MGSKNEHQLFITIFERTLLNENTEYSVLTSI